MHATSCPIRFTALALITAFLALKTVISVFVLGFGYPYVHVHVLCPMDTCLKCDISRFEMNTLV